MAVGLASLLPCIWTVIQSTRWTASFDNHLTVSVISLVKPGYMSVTYPALCLRCFWGRQWSRRCGGVERRSERVPECKIHFPETNTLTVVFRWIYMSRKQHPAFHETQGVQGPVLASLLWMWNLDTLKMFKAAGVGPHVQPKVGAWHTLPGQDHHPLSLEKAESTSTEAMILKAQLQRTGYVIRMGSSWILDSWEHSEFSEAEKIKTV